MQPKTKAFIAGAIVGVASIPTAFVLGLSVYAAIQLYHLRENSQRPEKNVEHIIPNHTNEYRTRAVESESDGIARMRTFCAEHDKEEAWAYLPQQSTWIEIGSDEAVETGKSSTAIDKLYLDTIIKDHDNIVLYHYHPSGDFLHGHIIKKLESLEHALTAEERSKVDAEMMVYRALPSTQDMSVMALQALQFYEEHPEGTLVHKICSHYGVAEYNLTPEGVKYYGDRFETQEWASEPAAGRALADEVLYLNEEKDPIKRIRRYCEMISTPRFTVTFKTYDELKE